MKTPWRDWQALGFVLGAALVGCKSGAECGDADTHTVSNGGECECEPGFQWEDPSDPDNVNCVPPLVCVPKCYQKECGDNGCGGVCGECSRGDLCDAGTCVEPPPDCGGAGCNAPEFCSWAEICVPPSPSVPTVTKPTCDVLPPMLCDGDETYCGTLVQFDPAVGTGYEDPVDRLSGDTQYRSWARRDLVILLKYAAAKTACLATGWAHGNGGAMVVGDLSEANGAIPGTSDGQPGHPARSHTDGHDADLGYFQVETPDNDLRPVCKYWIDNEDQYHCVGPPELLDVWRTALFTGILHEHPQFWIVGMDGRIGPLVEDAIDDLCARGWLAGDACSWSNIGYETTDGGIGWYYFHHHHMHVSIKDQQGRHPEINW